MSVITLTSNTEDHDPIALVLFVLQEHSNLLLSQAWLVKIDAANSTPYLIVRVPDSHTC